MKKVFFEKGNFRKRILRFIFVLGLSTLPLKYIFADSCSDPMGSVYECSGDVTYESPPSPRAAAPQAPSKNNYTAPARQQVYRPAPKRAPKSAQKSVPAVQTNTDVSPEEQQAQGSQSVTCPEGSTSGPNGCVDDNSYVKTTSPTAPQVTDNSPECKQDGVYDGHYVGIGGDKKCVADNPESANAGKNVVNTNDCVEGTSVGPDGKCAPDGSFDKSAPLPKKEAVVDQCAAAATTATSVCKGTIAAYATQLNGLNQLMGSFSSGNRAEACTVAAEVSKKQAILSAAMAASCQFAMSRCTSACVITNPDDPNAADWAKKSASCDSYQEYVVKNGIAAATQLATAKASSACAAEVTAAAIPAPLAPILPLPPPVALLDCGNAAFANANALQCYCQSNASDPKCASGSSGAGGVGSNSTRSGDNSGGGAGVSTPDVAGSGNPTVGAPAGSTAANSGGSSSPGGGSMGGPSGGGGVAALGVAEDGAGPAGAPNGGSIFGGFSSGQGGFSYGRGAGGGEGGGNAASRMFKSLAAKLNLNKIMPKRNDYLNRSVAGMSGTSRDGITGPNGPSIWEKVSRRYQIKKGEMLPP